MKPLPLVVLGILTLAAPAGATSTAAEDTLLKAVGTWGWVDETGEHPNSCANGPMNVSVDVAAGRYTTRVPGTNIVLNKADILERRNGWFSLRYDGDERVMDDGSPHIWVWFFTDDDTFVWVRKDWITDEGLRGTTGALERCGALNS